jgi:hypothetical protein
MTREGTCVPAGENFVFLTWNKQGDKSARGPEEQFYEEITFICHRDCQTTSTDANTQRNQLTSPVFEEEIHVPHPIQVQEFDGFGPLGE